MFGFINLNKPAGFTSHDCVAKLRKLLNTKKIGHGGTLDPDATGVLPIAVGKATRLLQFLPELKAYRAKIRLGVSTTTDDLSGEIIKTVDTVGIKPTEINDALDRFVGTIEQVPPIYSAIKKDGRKLYDLARRGEKIALESRTVNIFKIELVDIQQSTVHHHKKTGLAVDRLSPSEFYELEVNIECGPGTYIRAIARDLGEMLGVGGTLANLVRSKSCGMHLDRSVSFAEIESQLARQSLEFIEPSRILNHLGSVTLTQQDAKLWCQGQLVDLSKAIAVERISNSKEGNYIVTKLEGDTLLGISILFQRNDILKIKPKIVLNG